MKKSILLLCMALATMGAQAAKKNKKAAKAQQPKVELTTKTDTLSYNVGYSRTEGLLPYLQQQFKVDTAYMADFVSGIEHAMTKAGDPAFTAYLAGMQIEAMLRDGMIPSLSKQIAETGDSISQEKFMAGFMASLKGDTTVVNAQQAADYFKAEMEKVEAEKARIAAEKLEKEHGPNRDAGRKFLEENAKKDSVVTLPSGMQYKVLVQGAGPVAKKTDEVVVKYAGRLIDGTEFDSSYKRPGETSKFKPTAVIKGWTEALTMMPAGSKWELYIPYELAYGDRNMGKIKPYSALIFIVELVDIERGGKSILTATEAEKPAAKKATRRTSRKK